MTLALAVWAVLGVPLGLAALGLLVWLVDEVMERA